MTTPFQTLVSLILHQQPTRAWVYAEAMAKRPGTANTAAGWYEMARFVAKNRKVTS